jgi:thioredoxin-like negative regulator of GroEL
MMPLNFNKTRWLTWLLPLVFLGLICLAAWGRDPDFWRSTPALVQLAQDAAAAGHQDEALALARKAWGREPGNGASGVLLSRLLLGVGEPQAALEVCRRIPAGAAGADLFKIKTLAQARQADRPAALELLAAQLKEMPEDPELLEAAATIAAQDSSDPSPAIDYYRRLYQVQPTPQLRRRLVELLTGANLYREAIPLQEEEAAQSPADQEALHRLALLYYWQRDYQAAGPIYQRLVAKVAGDAALRLEAAQNAAAAHDTDQALAHYLWLYAHYQGKKEYAVALARLWDQKGNHAEAAGVLAPLTRENPEPELRRWYALELLLIGDFDKARGEYRAAWRAGDTHQETIINLARLYAQGQQFKKAAAMWDEAVRRQLIRGDLRWEAGLTYSYARRYQEALDIIEPLRRRNSKDPKLLLFSGQLNFYQKHWGQAVHFFKAYLDLNPQDVEVRRLLAEALSFQPKSRPEAANQYGEILKTKDDAALRLRRISLLLEERRWDDAARELKECPEPSDPRLIRDQAHLYLWLGNPDESLRHYDLFLKKTPLDPQGRLEKARVLTYLGRCPEALEMLNRLRQEQPKDAAVCAAAIEAYLTAKDYPKALSLAQKGLEPLADLSPDDCAVVARCYYHSGNPKDLLRARDLLLQEFWKKRHHHPTLLILTALLPKLPRYEDLNRAASVIASGGTSDPDSSTSIAYFDSQQGRQGGKLNYLLHVLRDYRHRRVPRSPGELLGLAWLATELEDRGAALWYYKRALKLRPHDQSIARLLFQCQMSQRDYGQALANLQKEGLNPGNALEVARLYLMRGQYEGVKAAIAQIKTDSPDHTRGQLLLARALRDEHSYPEALQTLAQLEGKVPRTEWLMDKAQVLEAMADRGAISLYEEVAAGAPGTQKAQLAQARQARTRGDWAAAARHYAQALKDTPGDVEVLNELEGVRQQMRPEMASRGFPYSRGERRPEEASRPWQYSRFDREPRGLGLSNYLPAFLNDVLPVIQPETLYLTDSNKLYGGIVRAAGAFWITKVLPAQLGVEFREYNQNSPTTKLGPLDLGLYRVFDQQASARSRLRRAEVSLGLGPLSVNDRLRLSGELILRRYWKRTDRSVLQTGQERYWVTDPVPHVVTRDTFRTYDFTTTDDQNRFFGSLQLDLEAGVRTAASLSYSRRDIFDQDPRLYPRLYQSVLNLAETPTITYHQVELAVNHQFRPGLDWRSNVSGAFFSDDNRRLRLFQGLAWQAVKGPRMNLEIMPQYYLAAYQDRHSAYFSPPAYHALGLSLDFDKQFFRLPTLILQGTVQAVGQHGDWGPALQGMAALEWEFVHNFYTDAHVFYFREWVDNYRILTAGLSFRWRF